MSGIAWLDGAGLAVSLFNTLVLGWLGLTVLLTAEQRRGGILLAGGGLLSGGLFFLSHTAILGVGLVDVRAGDFWWQVGWLPVILAPAAWYLVMLWYAGYWEGPRNPLHTRHRLPLALLAGAGAVLLLALLSSRVPSFAQVAFFRKAASGWSADRPTLTLFGLFIVACIGLSVDALLRPGPTERMMGGLARLRARPWLLGATFTLLLVSLLVAGVLLWAADELQAGRPDTSLGVFVAAMDLLIASLIGVAVLMTGQAVVAYEIFTGKALPRQGLRRYWQRALALAGGYSLLISLAISLRLPAIYALLLSAGLVVLFYALLGWRSYDERRRLLAELRPFVGGPRLVEAMLDDTRRESREQETGDRRQKTVLGALEGLRQEVLHARRAGVMALGASAPLFGEALFVPTVEPEQAEQALKAVAALAASGIAPNELCRPAAPSGEWEWVVPLWNAGGLGGALLLGPKEDGGLYTQEEIEAGQAAAERLVDLQAGAEMARRLMYLTRQRSAESQVVDRRTRRTLHDDVLPTLHAAMLTVESDPSGAAQALAGVHHRLADLLHELPNAAAANSARLGLAPALRMMVEDEFAGAFDETQWHVAPEANSAAALLSPVVVETVYYAAREAIRNAARHARRDGPLRLSVALEIDGPTLQVWVQDNGAGFRSADPTRGGGHGLALHSTLLAVLGGALSVENRDGWGTSILIRI